MVVGLWYNNTVIMVLFIYCTVST